MAPTKKSSSTKAPAKKPMERAKPWAPAKKSQYELERDERIKRNEEFMLSLGINPYGSGYLKEKKKSRSRRKRVPVVELTDEQRAALEAFPLDAFEAWMEPTLAELTLVPGRDCLGG